MLGREAVERRHRKKRNNVVFLAGSFLITNSLDENISSKKRLGNTVGLFTVVELF